MPTSINEILQNGVNFVKEYNGFYYIWPIHKDRYDDTMWVVNKKTGEIQYKDYTSYLTEGIDEKAKEIDPTELKERV